MLQRFVGSITRTCPCRPLSGRFSTYDHRDVITPPRDPRELRARVETGAVVKSVNTVGKSAKRDEWDSALHRFLLGG
jgi:hypothetical protein